MVRRDRSPQAPLGLLQERRRLLVLDRLNDASVDHALAVLLTDNVQQGEDPAHLGGPVLVQ
jgi:hypothetical protein